MRFSVLSTLPLFAGLGSSASILNAKSDKAIPNNYIVVLKSSVVAEAVTSHLAWADAALKPKGALRKKSFALPGFQGYHIQASEEVTAVLAESEDIAYIEPDQTFTLADNPKPSSSSRVSRNVQASAPWNLARISHHALGSTEYVYQSTTGIWVYILDTGVKTTHVQFQGLASFGFNAVGGSNDDANGHGTHLAGIVSSQTYGVVRYANIISVKALGDQGSSTTSTIISAINWAVLNMQSTNRVGKATALLAVNGAYSAALNNAVKSASNAGLFFAVPAGSDGTSGNTSPASEPTACTVAASTAADTVLSSSNYGPSIDIFAPGAQITSLWTTSNTAVATLSGTTMAAAHIAGLGAYFLALEGPRTPVALCERLKQVATQGVLSGVPAGTVNLLAYNLSGL